MKKGGQARLGAASPPGATVEAVPSRLLRRQRGWLLFGTGSAPGLKHIQWLHVVLSFSCQNYERWTAGPQSGTAPLENISAVS